jgi:replicative DNA helicase
MTTLGSSILSRRLTALVGAGNLSSATISTGLRDLDELLDGGLRPGQVTVVAGRTGIGCSVLGLGFARTAALNGTSSVFLAPTTGRDEVADLTLQVVEHSRRTQATVVLVAPLPARCDVPRQPTLADLELYPGLAQGADLVITVDRDDFYDRESIGPGEADLGVVKHRYGAQRLLTVLFQGHYSRFVDYVGLPV